jgi:hypothetical protein
VTELPFDGLPELPYDRGTSSGWSGSDTSHRRALHDDREGRTSARQTTVLRLLDGAEWRGLTWRDVAAATGWHHGQASGTLSVLHKAGRVARLTAARDRCAIYVLPRDVAGRDVEPAGRTQATVNAERLARVQALVDEWARDNPDSAVVRALTDALAEL